MWEVAKKREKWYEYAYNMQLYDCLLFRNLNYQNVRLDLALGAPFCLREGKWRAGGEIRAGQAAASLTGTRPQSTQEEQSSNQGWTTRQGLLGKSTTMA